MPDIKRKSSSVVIAMVLSVCVLVAGLAWAIWPSKTELTADTYEVAIALYRVCNQKDDSRLPQIEGKLDQLNSEDDPGVVRLREIVDAAGNGQWQVAMRDTRDILDDQTTK